MNKQFIALVALIFCVLGLGSKAKAQAFKSETSQHTVPVTISVSVEPRHGSEVPVIYREDVRVFQGQQRLKVIEWEPLRAEKDGLELFILVDDACDSSVGLQLEDLRKFMASQSEATAVGVGYIHNSTVQIVENLTRDHALAAKALRIPFGFPASYSSPYLAVSGLIDGWPTSANQRVLFLVSPGVDGLQPGLGNSYLHDAIRHAQRANVKVYAIYASTGGRFGRSLWRVNSGQSNLSQLADETGGEAYFQGLQTPISFTPFLEQLDGQLKRQYKLTFLANAETHASDQHIKLETEVPNAELVGPELVRIPAAK